MQNDGTGKEQASLPEVSYKDCASKDKDISINGIKCYSFHILSFPLDMSSLVQNRLLHYESALSIAKLDGESSKVRRYERSIKLIKEIIENIKAGKEINIGELPPTVPVPCRKQGINDGVIKRATDQESNMEYYFNINFKFLFKQM